MRSPPRLRLQQRRLPQLQRRLPQPMPAIQRSRRRSSFAGTAAPDIVAGKRVFQLKADCVNCHGWPGDGQTGRNPRSPGIPANLRETQLDTNTMIQVVSCGIPGSAMPFHDAQAYKDARCYGTTASDYQPGQMPTAGHFLNNQDIVNVVAYVQQKVKGRGPITKAECIEYFGKEVAACKNYN